MSLTSLIASGVVKSLKKNIITTVAQKSKEQVAEAELKLTHTLTAQVADAKAEIPSEVETKFTIVQATMIDSLEEKIAQSVNNLFDKFRENFTGQFPQLPTLDISNTDGATQLAQPHRPLPTSTAAVIAVLDERAEQTLTLSCTT